MGGGQRTGPCGGGAVPSHTALRPACRTSLRTVEHGFHYTVVRKRQHRVLFCGRKRGSMESDLPRGSDHRCPRPVTLPAGLPFGGSRLTQAFAKPLSDSPLKVRPPQESTGLLTLL